jgi:hypothetical protein
MQVVQQNSWKAAAAPQPFLEARQDLNNLAA